MAAGIDTGILTELHGRELGLNADRELVTPQGVVLPRESGRGLKVDIVNPTFSWADLLGNVAVDVVSAVNKPLFTAYKGSVKQFQFLVGDLVYCEYHIPHDYVLGTDVYIHVHWSHNATNVTAGGVVWELKAMYAKGHNQAQFSAEITASITATSPTGAGGQYKHQISETALSAAAGAGGLLVTGDLEPDGLILLRMELKTNTISPLTLPFAHYVDLHYQSTGIGTKNKSPAFN